MFTVLPPSTVSPQGAGNGSGNLADFQRVGQPGAVVVALRRKKHLCFLDWRRSESESKQGV